MQSLSAAAAKQIAREALIEFTQEHDLVGKHEMQLMIQHACADAISEALSNIGIDTSNDGKQHAQADFHFLRTLRRQRENLTRNWRTALVTFSVPALLAVAWKMFKFSVGLPTE